MKPLIESVPNFSEGRRPEVIQAIVETMSRAGGVHILDTSSDFDHNRTVVTLVGLPNEVEKAVFAGIRAAAELIDLNEHEGQHPRFGATDVIPFIPIQATTMADCVELAHHMGQRVATELGLPIYFYEQAALRPHYENLANIRKPSFQYEQLREAILIDPKWMPDMGPAEVGSAGACLIGARMPLIAYNVYLTTDKIDIAKKIAKAIRHSDGGLRYVKSSGFLVNGKAQVSFNLTDYTQTPLHRVIEMIRREAARYGVGIESSELIGLIPETALLDSAAWYVQLDGFTPDSTLENRIHAAESEPTILAQEEPPIPEDATSHVYIPPLNETRRPEQFVIAVAQATPAPGGGAVLALGGALAAALGEMVAALTIGKKAYAEVEDQMVAIQTAAYGLRENLLEAIGEDIQSVERLMAAIREAKLSGDGDAIQAATLTTADSPLRTARLIYEVLQLLAQVVELGNRSAVIDAAVGAKMGLAAIESAALNMRVNLLGITDEVLVGRYLQDMRSIVEQARPLTETIILTASQRVGLNEVF